MSDKNLQDTPKAFPNAFDKKTTGRRRMMQLVAVLVASAIVGAGLYLMLGNESLSESPDEVSEEVVECGVEAVDMGLSVRWASCNVGAETPAEVGGYYAWGDSQEHATFGWRDAKSYNRKYPTTLTEDVDIATITMGEGWRMPTEEEFLELIEKCEWREAERDGCYGFEIVAPNDNTIFLPAAGYKHDTTLYHDGWEALYWSASAVADNDNKRAKALQANNHERSLQEHYRYYGAQVRAVRE